MEIWKNVGQGWRKDIVKVCLSCMGQSESRKVIAIFGVGNKLKAAA